MRPLSDPPIPREDPDDEPTIPARRVDITERLASVDERQAKLLRNIDALAAQFGEEAPRRSRAPASNQAITLGPHRPPSSRKHESLPSVIVNFDADYAELVQRFIERPHDEQAESELLRLGLHAMPAIARRVLRGPSRSRARQSFDDLWPRVTDCGPLLRPLVAGQRRGAPVRARTHGGRGTPSCAFWATYLLTELAYVY